MFQIGDQVVYGVHGVCRVADVEKQLVSKKFVTYLVLEPSGQEGSRYLVPTSSEAAMSKLKPILSSAELETMLKSSEVRKGNWIQEENLRKQTYRELIVSGDRAGLVGMMHTLYRHKKAQAQMGKKVHLADENFLRDAEKILASEIAVVMGITTDDAKNYMRTILKAE